MENNQHKELLEKIEEINKKLDPIYNAYQTANTLGVWAKWLLGFLLLVASLILAFKQVFK